MVINTKFIIHISQFTTKGFKAKIIFEFQLKRIKIKVLGQIVYMLFRSMTKYSKFVSSILTITFNGKVSWEIVLNEFKLPISLNEKEKLRIA